jgi:hypothetical protein
MTQDFVCTVNNNDLSKASYLGVITIKQLKNNNNSVFV